MSAARILAAMKPGREYTITDICNRTKLPPDTVSQYVRAMLRSGRLEVEILHRQGQVRIYRRAE